LDRQAKIDKLLQGEADDVRRLALNALDDEARRANTFGSKQHRDGRDKAEKKYDDTRRAFEGLSDGQLDRLLDVGALPS
jgi:hypothetical protein